MIKILSRIAGNAFILADFVMNVDRYLNTWITMATALNKMVDRLLELETLSKECDNTSNEVENALRYMRSMSNPGDKVN